MTGRHRNALTRKGAMKTGHGGTIIVPPEPAEYGKHSKDWFRLSGILSGLNLGTAIAPQLSPQDREFLKEMTDGDFRGDPECRELYETTFSEEDGKTMWKFLHVPDLVEMMLAHEEIRDVRYLALMGALLSVGSRDHPLYGCHAPEYDAGSAFSELSEIVAVVTTDGMTPSGRIHPDYMGRNPNLNWLDVTGTPSMFGLFWGSPFNGDISLWDVSRVTDMGQMFADSQFNGDISGWDVRSVMNMNAMFSNSAFTGNVRDWQVSPACDTGNMFLDCRISEGNKPSGVRKRMLAESVSAALSRKKGLEISIAPCREISPAGDPPEYEKHTKDLFRFRDMLSSIAFDRPLGEQVSPSDREFLRKAIDSDDAGIQKEFEESLSGNDRLDLLHFITIGDFFTKIVERIPFDADDRMMAERLQKIESKTDPLYAALDMSVLHPDPTLNLMTFSDAFVFGAAPEYMGRHANMNWMDVSRVTDLSGMLACNKVFDGDISLWDVSNVETAASMFRGSVFDGDISGWDVRKMRDVSNMFQHSAFRGDISGWQVSDRAVIYNSFSDPDTGERETHDLFWDCPIPDDNKPECLRDMLIDGTGQEINEGYSHALTRKDGQAVSIDPGKAISRPREAGTYEKHSKAFFWIQRFTAPDGRLDGLRKDRESGIDYAALDGEDISNLRDVLSGNAEKAVMEIARESGIRELFDPRSVSEIYEMSEMFDGFGWMDCISAGNPVGFSMSVIMSDGRELPVQETDDLDGAVLVRLATPAMKDSVLIPVSWAEMSEMTVWQAENMKLLNEYGFSGAEWEKAKEAVRNDLDGWGNTERLLRVAAGKFPAFRKSAEKRGRIAREEDYVPALSFAAGCEMSAGDRHFSGYLPALGELIQVSLYLDVVGKAIDMCGGEWLDFGEKGTWSSTEHDRDDAWCCHGDGETYAVKDRSEKRVIPFFREMK